MFLINFFLFIFATIISLTSAAPQIKLRGLRVDPAYFYNLYPGQTAAEVAKEVVQRARYGLVNTLFVYAYNPIYGAQYPTTYRHTTVENGFGRLNILKEISTEARRNGIKTIAVVPVNNFKTLWENKEDWRSKDGFGKDYLPAKNIYLLSAWHPEFRAWLKGFYEDLIAKNPEIDGVEAMEPMLDYNWEQESDFNLFAVVKFRKLYPKAELGDQTWLNFRAEGLTGLIGILNSVANASQKVSFLVQTWPARSDGHLVSHAQIKNNIGLDFDGILNLKGKEKLNYIIVELMWQQWAAEYGPKKFPVTWTKQATEQFLKFVRGRSAVLIHVEVTLFVGKNGVIIPTPEDLSENMKSLREMDVGIEVYDHYQIARLNAWDHLATWY